MLSKMMRKWIVIWGIGLLAIQADAGEAPVLKTWKERASYSIGVGVAKNIKAQAIEVDVDLVVKGLKDALSGGKLLISEGELRTTLNRIQLESRNKQDQAAKIAAAENKKAGDAFLAENKKKEGVMTLPSGLQYKVIKMGEGKKPTEADQVECRYRGALVNGTEFDSSERSGQPTVTFPVKGLVAGIREALQIMPVGSTWQLFIPPELAYGAQGAGMEIGPNATLIFDLELIAIK